MLGLITILLLLTTVFAEPIPNYDKPYAPIYFDKDVYTWTDKVRITIVAPAWNTNEYGIDSIGDDAEHPIKISTPSHSLNRYELTETSPNSGIFSGEITLTGFSHDVDGNGNADTTPRTNGNGPNGGFLEIDRDDGITTSFEFADGVVLTKSIRISWNVGEVKFSNQNYLGDNVVVIRVSDPDMNLNPETLDSINLDVSSESDSAGVTIVATETDDESGIFEATLLLTQSDISSGNKLHALPTDIITAIYKDRTLPAPYSIQDELDIIAKLPIESDSSNNEKITIDKIYLANSNGRQTDSPKQNQQVQIITQIQNLQPHPQHFTNIIQITDESGTVVSLSWVTGNLSESQSFDISQSWIPKQKGQHTIETFVWNSLDDTTPLSETQIQTVFIQ